MQARVLVEILVEGDSLDEDELAVEVQEQLGMALYDIHMCGAKVVKVNEFESDEEFAWACSQREPILEERARRWLNR